MRRRAAIVSAAGLASALAGCGVEPSGAGPPARERAASAAVEAPGPPALSRATRVEARRAAPPPPFRRRLAEGGTYEVACLVPAGEKVRFVATLSEGERLLDVVHEAPAGEDIWIAHRVRVPASVRSDAATVAFDVAAPGRAGVLARLIPAVRRTRAGFAEPRAIAPPASRSADRRPNVLLVVSRGATRASLRTAAASLRLGGLWLPDVLLSAPVFGSAGERAFEGRLRVWGGAVLDASGLASALAAAGYRTTLIGAPPRTCSSAPPSSPFELIRCPARPGADALVAESLAVLRASGDGGPWLLAVATPGAVAGADRPFEPTASIVAWIRDRGLLHQTIVVLVSSKGAASAPREAPDPRSVAIVTPPRAQALVSWRAMWPEPEPVRFESSGVALPATIARLALGDAPPAAP